MTIADSQQSIIRSDDDKMTNPGGCILGSRIDLLGLPLLAIGYWLAYTGR